MSYAQSYKQETGRVVVVQSFQTSDGQGRERLIATIDAAEWRSGIDIAVDPKGGVAALTRGLVRLYAIVGSVRYEIARGRVEAGPYGSTAPVPGRVLRARGEGGEKYEITWQNEANHGPAPQVDPVMSWVLFGNEPTEEASDPLTTFQGAGPGVTNLLLVTGLPSKLFSIAASGVSLVNDVWLMLFDANGSVAAPTPVNGNAPVIPPIWVPVGGKGNESLDFGKRPYPFQNGMYLALSSTPGTLTFGAAADMPITLIEFL